jgi:hypothetical protein
VFPPCCLGSSSFLHSNDAGAAGSIVLIFFLAAPSAASNGKWIEIVWFSSCLMQKNSLKYIYDMILAHH